MIRINIQYFYRLASNLIPLRNLQADLKITDQFGILFTAEKELEYFLSNPLIPPGTSFGSGKELLDTIQSMTNNLARPDPVSQHEVLVVMKALYSFETVLAAEYSLKDIFVVSKKGIFSTTDLIERAEEMFSPDLRERMPDIAKDIHDAGRCLAFELPTGAAFHLYRATEAGAKHYIQKVRGTPVTEEEKRFGLGGYAKIMKTLKVDERISNAVSQLTKLHRNPAIHPDQHLSTDEVICVLGIVQSVIQVMALDMQRLDVAPEMPLIEYLTNDADCERPSGGDHGNDNIRPGDQENPLGVEAGIAETVGS